MPSSHSISTTELVALLAAHRMAGGDASTTPAPLDPRDIARIADRLWAAEPARRQEPQPVRPV